MNVELLVAARDLAQMRKGEIRICVEVPDLGVNPEWGNLEGPPDFCYVRITGTTKQQVRNYTNPIKHVFEYQVVQRTAGGARIKINVDARVVGRFGGLADIRQEMRDYLEEEWEAVNVPDLSDPPTTYVMDFPIPGIELDDLRNDFEDRFVTTMETQRFMFTDADVELAKAEPDWRITITRQMAADRIVDKLGAQQAQGRRRRR